MSDPCKPSVLPPMRCAGIGVHGSGYPNAVNTIRRLRGSGVDIDDRTDWLPSGFQLWKKARGGALSKLLLYWKLLYGGAAAALQVCRINRQDPRITYVPYPAPFLLWWLSWVPRRWRPTLVADAYISIWDSAVRDRALAGSGGVLGRLLRCFEGRALRTANAVIVDTVENRRWMIVEFRLAADAVFAIPLAIEDTQLLDIPPRRTIAPLRVLYIGTFVPLHGIDVLVAAVRTVAPSAAIHFHFIGDGQEAGKVEALLTDGDVGITWERGWMDHQRLVEQLAECDVCVGVFGGSSKAARVLPFKLYLALAAGRAVVTQDQYSLPEGVPAPPFSIVAPEPKLIANQLVALAQDADLVMRLGEAGRRHYLDWLGPEPFLLRWQDVLAKLAADRPTSVGA